MEYTSFILELGLRWLLTGILVFYIGSVIFDICDGKCTNVIEIFDCLVAELIGTITLLVTQTKGMMRAIIKWPRLVYCIGQKVYEKYSSSVKKL